MLRLGETQILQIVKKADFGLYLKEVNGNDEDAILLPKKEAPMEAAIGEQIEAFVYKDSDDRYICTTLVPKIQLGSFVKLKVVQITGIGAFLDWGLMKDLFLPFKEQVGTIKEGESYLVGLYIDKSQRLCGTMKITKLLSNDHTFKEGDGAKGIIYNVHKELGVFVAVEGKYQGLIPMKEVTKQYTIGDEIEFKVAKVKQDGRLDLTIGEHGFVQMEVDEEKLYQALVENGGKLSLNDGSSKEKINKELDMSKRAFKRALGRLMKANKVAQTNDGIHLKE